jgi:hypothetical protein
MEECGQRVFNNRVLRKIFGLKREEVIGDWRKLHTEELYVSNTSPNVMRMIKPQRRRWVEHMAHLGEKRNAYRVSVGKSVGKSLLQRLRHIWR